MTDFVFYLFVFTILFLFVLLVLIFQKKEKKVPLRIFFETTEDFQKNIEKIILQQVRKNLSEIQEKANKEYENFFELLRKNLNSQKKDIEEKIAVLSQNLEKEVLEIKNFSSKVQIQLSRDLQEKEREIFEKLEEIFQKTKEHFFSQINAKIEAFEKSLCQEIVKITESTQELFKKRVKEMEKEIEELKEERKKVLEEKFYEILERVLEEFFEKSLDLSFQENLVLKILEKAKKEIESL